MKYKPEDGNFQKSGRITKCLHCGQGILKNEGHWLIDDTIRVCFDCHEFGTPLEDMSNADTVIRHWQSGGRF